MFSFTSLKVNKSLFCKFILYTSMQYFYLPMFDIHDNAPKLFKKKKQTHSDIVKNVVYCFWCNIPASGSAVSFSENDDSRPYLQLLLDMQYLYSEAKRPVLMWNVRNYVTYWDC